MAAALQKDQIDDDDTNLEQNELGQEEIGEDGISLVPYPASRLKRWEPAPVVKPIGNALGEMGMKLKLRYLSNYIVNYS